MATKSKKPATKQTSSKTKVTRITASDTGKSVKKEVKTKKATAIKVATDTKPTRVKKERKNPLKAIGGYFKGAWYELRQVRWPNRKATWSLTAAVIAFTAFFAVLVLLLDALFKYLFELILG